MLKFSKLFFVKNSFLILHAALLLIRPCSLFVLILKFSGFIIDFFYDAAVIVAGDVDSPINCCALDRPKVLFSKEINLPKILLYRRCWLKSSLIKIAKALSFFLFFCSIENCFTFYKLKHI